MEHYSRSLHLFSIIILIFNFSTFTTPSTTFDIVNFGAKPDEETDSSDAFQEAWSNACGCSDEASIYVPEGRFYLSSVTLNGPCKNNGITIRIDGTIMGSSDLKVIGKSRNWIIFRSVNGVNIVGGILDGQGSPLWDCKNADKNCPEGATSLEFSNSENIMINELSSMNSQKFHIVMNQCKNVKMEGVKVSAPDDSPNTDGIHVEESSFVTILNSDIGTGDDCISIGPGTSNLWIEGVSCGPGHGISIGSLGKELEEDGVENVTVKSATFSNSRNGVRIKTWGRPSNGFVRNILFQDITMSNVENPIIIDQNYCPNKKHCSGKDSGIKISDVSYEDIHGTSATELGIKLECSSKNPCSGIRIENVRLDYKDEAAKAWCNNAKGAEAGSVEPDGDGIAWSLSFPSQSHAPITHFNTSFFCIFLVFFNIIYNAFSFSFFF